MRAAVGRRPRLCLGIDPSSMSSRGPASWRWRSWPGGRWSRASDVLRALRNRPTSRRIPTQGDCARPNALIGGGVEIQGREIRDRFIPTGFREDPRGTVRLEGVTNSPRFESGPVVENLLPSGVPRKLSSLLPPPGEGSEGGRVLRRPPSEVRASPGGIARQRASPARTVWEPRSEGNAWNRTSDLSSPKECEAETSRFIQPGLASDVLRANDALASPDRTNPRPQGRPAPGPRKLRGATRPGGRRHRA